MDKKTIKQNRREFLKKAGLLLGAGVTATSLSSLIVSCRDETIPLPPPPPPGASYNINVKDYPNLGVVDSIVKCEAVLSTDSSYKILVIVRVLPDDKFLIVSGYCSHQSDQELPSQANAQLHLVCPRHQAEFSLKLDEAGKLVVDPNNVNSGPIKVYDYEYKKEEGIIVLDIDVDS
jgi:nitrite reductase/ring-hydroxylating ferredoxin subunit